MADIDATNWSSTDASNTTAAPDGAPEGMSPGGVNNVLRANMGAIKRYRNHLSPKTTAGTATAYTLAYDVAPGALYDGATHLIQFHAANGAAATLNVNALGAAPLHYYAAGAWRVAPTGLVGTDQVLRVAYNTAAGAYRILDADNRTGEVVMYAGATAPAGTLLCYGQAISRTDYAGLFAVLSTTHGVGDGSSSFNLPDLRGRVGAGLGNMGGSESGRLNSIISSVLGAGGGVQSTSTTGNCSVNGSTAGATAGAAIAVQAGSNSGPFTLEHHSHSMSFNAPVTTVAFGLVQPTLVLNYVIRI